jgi:hypothetical protein
MIGKWCIGIMCVILTAVGVKPRQPCHDLWAFDSHQVPRIYSSPKSVGSGPSRELGPIDYRDSRHLSPRSHVRSGRLKNKRVSTPSPIA